MKTAVYILVVLFKPNAILNTPILFVTFELAYVLILRLQESLGLFFVVSHSQTVNSVQVSGTPRYFFRLQIKTSISFFDTHCLYFINQVRFIVNVCCFVSPGPPAQRKSFS